VTNPETDAMSRAERRRGKPLVAIKPGDHLNALDGVRALAVFSVVATHVGFQTGRAVNGFWAPLLARLDFGVTLFFLLSGFLLYRPFVTAALDLRPTPNTRRFLTRRVARILPAYWLLLGVTMWARPWSHAVGLGEQKTTLTDWFEYATLTHIYFGDNPHQSLTQIWSLVVEMAFYLALPLIAAVSLRGKRLHRIMRRQTTALVVLLIAGPLYGLIVHQIPALRDRLALQWLPAYLDWFALGMLLACLPAAASLGAWARLRKIVDDLAEAPGTCWIIAAGLFALAMTPVAGPYNLSDATTSQWVAKHVLYGACAFMLLLPLVVPGDPRHPLRAVLSNRRVRWLGEISYGVFLYHLTIMFTLVDVLHLQLFRGGFFTLFPLTVVSAVIAAAISYRVLERPILNRVRGSSTSKPPAAAPADAGSAGAAGPAGAVAPEPGKPKIGRGLRGWEALPGPGAGAPAQRREIPPASDGPQAPPPESATRRYTIPAGQGNTGGFPYPQIPPQQPGARPPAARPQESRPTQASRPDGNRYAGAPSPAPAYGRASVAPPSGSRNGAPTGQQGQPGGGAPSAWHDQPQARPPAPRQPE
jgi:peptidoglycan/LPS O-acetylase OafA/YrhL